VTTRNCTSRTEAGKKHFVGHELPGRTLGIVGLGAIGSLVADAAIRLGMKVIGFDPEITVDAAWRLPSQVRKAAVGGGPGQARRFHQPARAAGAATKNLINAERVEADEEGLRAAQLRPRRHRRTNKPCSTA
jgi:D-3-phosphoglycerate dehydrogenase